MIIYRIEFKLNTRWLAYCSFNEYDSAKANYDRLMMTRKTKPWRLMKVEETVMAEKE